MPVRKQPAKKAAKKAPAKKVAKKAAKKMGRPTKLKPEIPKQAYMLASKGFTDAEIAEFLGLALSTVSAWKVKDADFSGALKAGKEIPDSAVERSLFERATGYKAQDTHITNYKGRITKTPIIKHYPPDTTAMIFWLKNRRPDVWRDKTESHIEHKGDITIVIGGDVDLPQDEEDPEDED